MRLPRKRLALGASIAACFMLALWGLSKQHHRQHNRRAHSTFLVQPSGDYFAVKFSSYDDDTAEHWYLPDRRIPSKGTCWEYARSIEEPMTRQYAPKRAIPELGSHAPRAFWRWPGNITKAAFDKAAAKEWPGCVHCMDVVPYKLLGGRLYVHKRARGCMHREVAEEMLKVVLYLFPMPDMEFLLHFGDGCTVGLPAISWNVCRQFADAGFAMPSYSVWDRSLGPEQMRAYHSCLNHRYPAAKRKPLAVWRGSTTDTRLPNFKKDNYLQALRVQLHMFARNHTDVLDVRIANPLNCDDFVRAQIPDTGSNLAFEDFNQYCAIVDVDGNGWSDRFGQLVHFNTPIIKIASNHTGFFEHLFAPGVAIDQFARNLTDLPERARRLVEDCKAGGGAGRQLVRSMQATTRALLDHVGIAEGLAYTLQTYHRLSAWRVEPNLTDYNEVGPECCKYSNVPKRFAAAVAARMAAGAAADAAGRKGLKAQGGSGAGAAQAAR